MILSKATGGGITIGSAFAKWIAGGLAVVLLSAGGAYGAWVNTSIVQLQTEKANLEFHMTILESKIDLLLKERGVVYNGPEYTKGPGGQH